MDKNKLLSIFNSNEHIIVSSIYDKLYVSERSGRTVFTKEFYSPNIWKIFLSLSEKIDTGVFTYGIFDEAERRMIAFSSFEPENYPMKLIRIRNKSKFSTLSHRDYLGSIMSLGIIREKYGDLIMDGSYCYVPVLDEIADFLLLNLKTVGNCPCEAEIIGQESNLVPKVKFEDMVVISTSLRLDCIVSALTGVSRSQSEELISKGKVLIDYAEICEKNRAMKEDSVVTIRGYGKYRIDNMLGFSSKGRLKLNVKKYV